MTTCRRTVTRLSTALCALSALLCAAPSAAQNGFPLLTTTDVAELRAAIIRDFAMAATYGDRCDACPLGDTYGALVRLAFHDAFGGGRPSATGGANGCLDPSFVGHGGMSEIVTALASSWAPFSARISRADYWVLAAQTAIEFASTTSPAGSGPLPPSPGTLVLPFRYGRVDAATCSGADAGMLPDASFTWAQSSTMFGRIGLTIAETVALFGAHALGRAEWKNSGFHGGWTLSQSSFSNTYFANMLGIPWRNNNITANSNLWLNNGGGGQTLLLRADSEVAIAPVSPGCPVFGGATPPSAGCPVNALTSAALTSFRGSTAAWYSSFATAWRKMVDASYSLADPAAPALLSASASPMRASVSATASASTTKTRAPASVSATQTASASSTKTRVPASGITTASASSSKAPASASATKSKAPASAASASATKSRAPRGGQAPPPPPPRRAAMQNAAGEDSDDSDGFEERAPLADRRRYGERKPPPRHAPAVVGGIAALAAAAIGAAVIVWRRRAAAARVLAAQQQQQQPGSSPEAAEIVIAATPYAAQPSAPSDATYEQDLLLLSQPTSERYGQQQLI